MTAEEFEVRILNWTRSQPDVEALVQIGSRAQAGAEVDAWSDWDYQLIVRDTKRYRKTDWLEAIAPCWNAHLEQTGRDVAKISFVVSGGREADFVILPGWQMKLVYWAMAHPGMCGLFPPALIKGVYNTRLFVGPGYKVLVGGLAWEQRLAALTIDWPIRFCTSEDFYKNLSGFWRHAVWVHKKIMRGEIHAALRWYHAEIAERRLTLLAEEAQLGGRPARPEARKAEQWLDSRRLQQAAIVTSPDQRVLAKALLAEISLFEEVSRSVAESRGFSLPDHSQVAAWLRAELNKLSPPA